MAFKLTLAVDFDGVINPYSRGWQKGELYETKVTDGFWQWLERTSKDFECVIHSSRFAETGGMAATLSWLKECYKRDHGAEARLPYIKFSATKPPAYITIDDRCILFNGDWSDEALTVENLKLFKPWTQRR